ncbi:putative lipid II flippase FtsW [Pseudofrankia inefficax]|uniref:Probable peptidoglycan glycosyltransferase FtsW n=1 Tax=Pseudofrankia inefficax (strain DSM 45817 / CECT 9037 / DDB 130130 / EuI1c) TaxID=298654 RepID=E3J0C9_PSEI1|nr:cell division protein FtsW [Pseudofrankia inefficax]
MREAPSSRSGVGSGGAGSGGSGSASGQRTRPRAAVARPGRAARAGADDGRPPTGDDRPARRERPAATPRDAGTLPAPREDEKASGRDGARPATTRDAARPAGSRESRRPATLRDAMAPAVRRPRVPAAAASDQQVRAGKAARQASQEAARRAGGVLSVPGRGGQRRSVLRPVPSPDTPGAALARLPLLERPLASYYLLGSSAGLLLLLGLVMVLSASNVRSYAAFGSSYTVFVRQATWMGIGLPVLLAASRAPSQWFRRVAYPLMGLTLLLLLAVLSPLGVSSNGAQRWLGVGTFSLQPSELAKLALVLWSADLLTRKRRLLGDWKHLIVPVVPVSALIGGLIMMQPDMGTTIVVFAVLFVVLWVVGTPGRVYAGLVGVLGAVGAILAVIEPYRLERLLSYRDPFQNAQTTGWQAVQGIYALAGGGWFGEGLGASKEKWPDLLPASYTDFILAIIGEELGLLGCLVVVILFGVFGYAGLRVAHRSDNQFVRLAAAGSTGWILTQAVVNMGAVVGLLPITGIPLPLVSFGGSSLVLTMFSIGMLLAFARSEPAAARLLAERSQRRREARQKRRRGPRDRARDGAAAGGAGSAPTRAARSAGAERAQTAVPARSRPGRRDPDLSGTPKTRRTKPGRAGMAGPVATTGGPGGAGESGGTGRSGRAGRPGGTGESGGSGRTGRTGGPGGSGGSGRAGRPDGAGGSGQSGRAGGTRRGATARGADGAGRGSGAGRGGATGRAGTTGTAGRAGRAGDGRERTGDATADRRRPEPGPYRRGARGDGEPAPDGPPSAG